MVNCYRFVFCRQRQDEKLKRGGEQKSVVVLSHQPYSSTLIPLAQYAGPLYFNNGSGALQEVRHLLNLLSAIVPMYTSLRCMSMSQLCVALMLFKRD